MSVIPSHLLVQLAQLDTSGKIVGIAATHVLIMLIFVRNACRLMMLELASLAQPAALTVSLLEMPVKLAITSSLTAKTVLLRLTASIAQTNSTFL